MGVMKRAPVLGSSASVEATGRSVIEGDRSLLSHYGTSPERQDRGVTVAARKSAALRRNFVARGLAKQYGDQKRREENFKAQVPRYHRQQKILENYHRQQERLKTCDDKPVEASKRHEAADDEDDFSQNVVLVLPKRTASAPLKSSPRPTRRMSPVVPPKSAVVYLRNASMRQLRDSQHVTISNSRVDDTPQSDMAASLKVFPSEGDISRAQLRPVPCPSSSKTQKEIGSKFELNKNAPVGPVPWLTSAAKSSKIVLRELAITKDIMMREQLARQLKQVLPLVDILAQDFLKAQDDYKQAQAALELAKAMSPSRLKKTGSLIGLTLTSSTRPDVEAQNAVAEAEVLVTESNARLAEFTKRLKHHLHHVDLLVNGLRQATLTIIEGILDWRQMRQRRRQITNFQRLFRFPWRKQKILNYLLHLDGDLRTMFPSVALELLLGPKAAYNPLLLQQATLKGLGTSSSGKTFITERGSNSGSISPLSREQSKNCCINSAGLKKIKEALTVFVIASDGSPAKPKTSSLDPERLRQCLEAIRQESELEELERQRCGEEERRIQNTYDPFSTIKSAGGVEETLSNMMLLQSPNLQLLGEQLRIRQEDTTRAASSSNGRQLGPYDPQEEILHVNPERLRDVLKKRAALLEPVANCELREIQRWGLKNKLQGKIMVRKNNEKRVEHILARKIQLQYLAHRQRNEMQSNLTRFVRNVRISVVNIQRIFRGHRAKCDFECMRNSWLEHKRRVGAVRIIVNSFRRYRRRLRHRRSMTVESIAQAQLINLLANKLNETDADDAAEKYRRVGEERRRQRIVLLQKHKMEQQEMERKRVAAAVRMQAVVRAHLAQGQAKILRQEKKAHMTAVSAMAIQSTIRKFLTIQQDRRQRFRKDLERVNQSAVRIQSIYRGYNSRASLLGQLYEQTRQTLDRSFTVNTLHEGDTDDEEEDEEEEEENEVNECGNGGEKEESPDVKTDMKAEIQTLDESRLPPITRLLSRPLSGRSNSQVANENPASRSQTPTNPVSLPPLWNRDGSSSSLLSSTSSTGTGRRISMGMTRIELKLKEAELGDKFDTPPSRRNSFVGNMRHQT
ncbi:unnamed protein product [Phytophthora lilii]|uniref:Unnamed protein product n=1 Tax=Phytophthora lilii TaxID=2077276 RepID=A0A9W6TF75_9STRA|nr:unnamed protein product [Phytophthora lilii]